MKKIYRRRENQTTMNRKLSEKVQGENEHTASVEINKPTSMEVLKLKVDEEREQENQFNLISYLCFEKSSHMESPVCPQCISSHFFHLIA